MRLIEREYCWIIEDVFPSNVTAGFTKPDIRGYLPQGIDELAGDIGKDFALAYLNQIHSSKVNFIEKAGVYEGDALFSKNDNCLLAVRTADCLPLFFHYAAAEVIGIVHMGWRGAAAGILDNIGGDLSGYTAVAGVGLRRCCYQVGDEFRNYAVLLPFINPQEGRLYFDVLGFVKRALSARGIKNNNFFDLGICSFCAAKKFPSWRRCPFPERTLSFIMKR